MQTIEQIATKMEETKREWLNAKPRSRRRIKLEMELQRLLLKRLRLENRIERRKAA